MHYNMGRSKKIDQLILASIGIAIVLSTLAFVSSTTSSTYWYVDGVKDVWFVQEDVYAFRTTDSEVYKGNIDYSIVDKVIFRDNYPDKLHFVYFKESASSWDRQGIIRNIEHHAQFSRAFPTITRFNTASYKDGLWYAADDQLLVTFKGGTPDKQTLSRFMNKYGLVAMNDPSNLPEGGNYSYILKWDASDMSIENSILSARAMYLADSNMVLNVEPNLLRAYDQGDGTFLSTGSNDKLVEEDKFYVMNEGNNELQVFFNIHSSDQQMFLRVLDLYGREFYVSEVDVQDNQHRVDISVLPSGMYFSCITDESGKVLVSQRFQIVQ